LFLFTDSAELYTLNLMNVTSPLPETSETDLMTAEEVMDRLLDVAALKQLASTCVLPAIRRGNEWRFRRTDLEAWIVGQLASTRSTPS
jgi:hypothetical protein